MTLLQGDHGMHTIDTTATVTPEGLLTLRVPPEIPPGSYHIVLVMDVHAAPPAAAPLPDAPILQVGPWPAHLSLRREDLYADESC